MDAVKRAKSAGDAAYRQQQYELAIQKYGEAIKASEESLLPDLLHVLYSNRAAAKLATRDYQAALADAQAAVAVDDTWVKGWFRSAKALQGLGDYTRAVQAAAKALELEPGNRELQALLEVLQHHTTGSSGGCNGTSSSSSGSGSDAKCSHGGCPGQHALHRQQQQPPKQQQQQLPWQQLCALRASLNFSALPSQLVVGSQYLPSADGVHANLLLLLHGLGDTPAAFTALARRMQLPQTASLALSGPLQVPATNGGRAWLQAFDENSWELIQPHAGEQRRTATLAATVQLLQFQLLPALRVAGGWQHEQIQLLGFSQGATVALELARRCKGAERLGGVVAVSASLLEETLLMHSGTRSTGNTGSTVGEGGTMGTGGTMGACGTAVLLTHGDKDDVVPRSLVNRTVHALQADGCDVKLLTLPSKGHGMIDSADEMKACMTFWAAHLRSRPAAANESYVEVPREAAAAVIKGLQ